MSCPFHHSPQQDVVGDAIRKCPFLVNLAQSAGESAARQIAVKPHLPISPSAPTVLLEEDYGDFMHTLKLFHGKGGIVPLKKFDVEAPTNSSDAARRSAGSPPLEFQPQPCAEPDRQSSRCPMSSTPKAGRTPCKGAARAPFATISLSGGLGPLVRFHPSSTLIRESQLLIFQ